MAGTTDRRVRRTRTALIDALLALMVEKGYDAITVQDLIDRADVGRSTFYAHFTDKSDLLAEAMGTLRDALAPTPGSPAPDRRRPYRFSLPLFRHVHDQHRLLQALLGRPGGGAVIAQIEQALLEAATADLAALTPDREPPRVPPDLLARAAVATCLATLRWWVDNGFRESAEELEAVFRTMVAPGVRAAL